jgi:hypothetical protein
VLEGAGVFVEGAGVLDGLGVDGVVLLVEDEMLEADGGLAPAPLAGPKSGMPCGEGARFLIRRLRLT